MNPLSKVGQVRASSPIVTGLGYSFIWLAGAILVLALLLATTGMQEKDLSVWNYVVHSLVLLVGGFITGRRSGQRGWYFGGITGLLYGFLILLISFLGFDKGFGLSTLAFLALSFSAAALGGMVGVNTRK